MKNSECRNDGKVEIPLGFQVFAEGKNRKRSNETFERRATDAEDATQGIEKHTLARLSLTDV